MYDNNTSTNTTLERIRNADPDPWSKFYQNGLASGKNYKCLKVLGFDFGNTKNSLG